MSLPDRIRFSGSNDWSTSPLTQDEADQLDKLLLKAGLWLKYVHEAGGYFAYVVNREQCAHCGEDDIGRPISQCTNCGDTICIEVKHEEYP